MHYRACCWLCCAIVFTGWLPSRAGADDRPRVGLFHVDASPAIGSPLAYDPCVGVTDPLSLSGVVILSSGAPVVIAAVDWIGVANEGHRELRQRLAVAAGTTPDRVTVHALHQHDAPRVDFSAAALLDHYGIAQQTFDVPWAREVYGRAAEAVARAVVEAIPFDRVGVGMAEVREVASNRRLLNADGQVIATRYTATRDPKVRDLPTGTIDPTLRALSLWSGERPIVVLTYYATHPQSYYRTGLANPDFPGYARDQRQRQTGVPHIHFNGAGGNIGAGKWNDGSPENRQVLADRVADGMRRAWEATATRAVTASDIGWESVAVRLPPAAHLREDDLVAKLRDRQTPALEALGAATKLAWLQRCQAGETVEIGCLRIGDASVLHLPGELFVEYQLAAAALRPDRQVMLAAYGEYAPGYIGTRVAYGQGGYETSERASNVSPDVEAVLVGAMAKLLRSEIQLGPLGVPHDGVAAAQQP